MRQLLARDKLARNLTCLQPAEEGGVDAVAAGMKYVFDQAEHANLPLKEGRRCEEGACCEACSRVTFPAFATAAETDLQVFPDLEGFNFNGCGKCSTATILNFVRLVERIRRSISHEYGLPLSRVLPVQARRARTSGPAPAWTLSRALAAGVRAKVRGGPQADGRGRLGGRLCDICSRTRRDGATCAVACNAMWTGDPAHGRGDAPVYHSTQGHDFTGGAGPAGRDAPPAASHTSRLRPQARSFIQVQPGACCTPRLSHGRTHQ